MGKTSVTSSIVNTTFSHGQFYTDPVDGRQASSDFDLSYKIKIIEIDIQ